MECQVVSGRCVLLNVESLENLVSFFQMISPQRRCIPYEIKGVSNSLVEDTDQNESVKQSVNETLLSKCQQKRKCLEDDDQCKMANPKTSAKRAKHKNTEDALSRQKRLEKCREYKKQKIACETAEQLAKRLQANKTRYARMRKNESAEHREHRLQVQQANNIKRRKNESAEHRENRLHVQQVIDIKQRKNESVNFSEHHRKNRLDVKQVNDIKQEAMNMLSTEKID